MTNRQCDENPQTARWTAAARTMPGDVQFVGSIDLPQPPSSAYANPIGLTHPICEQPATSTFAHRQSLTSVPPESRVGSISYKSQVEL